MDCVLQRSAHVDLRRMIEVIGEGSSLALLLFHPEQYLTVQALDATWMCSMTVIVPETCWHTWNVPRPLHIRIDIRTLMEILRKSKGARQLHFKWNHIPNGTGPFWPDQPLQVFWIPTEMTELTDQPDDSPYHSLVDRPPWPHCTLPMSELCNIMLDLSVGGTEVNLKLTPDGHLHWYEEFDTGIISFDTECTEHQTTRIQQSGPFVVKWLKLICSLVTYYEQATLFLDDHTLVIDLDNSSLRFVLCLKTYLGPHGFILPECIRNIALRVQL